ncbi:MAG: hypothetical protein IPI59_15110 [Sphingobacteriales bacterium]|jgi:hypothetical protein|nr:hypothetical protein [Sphingobacteriales bacterium]MBP9140595.1 hypothetical protein [Chitinophagales bacterium]MDA0197385.1 hypothetical protein [Bacteroidota bacterium]MBK6888665.1 hypothetical protein [Sphingobacteriales bacterium]MBK7528826.1 hypothetical protein [Sphingobacteriales bacterium]
MQARFADLGLELLDFQHSFVVHCQKCNGRAVIDSGKKLCCTNCFYTQSQPKWLGRYKLFVCRKCANCNHILHHTIESEQKWPLIPVTCPNCKHHQLYEATASQIAYAKGLKLDPYYGLPLWYQAGFKNELFWAYNEAHLNYIAQYITAKVRERGIEPRNSIRKNSSLISRLPEFIKKSGNRASLLKLIEKLQLKV